MQQHASGKPSVREKLCRELDEVARKPDLGAGDLDILHKITDTVKNIDKIEMLEDGDYSRAGEWEADMRGTYGRGSSYARRGTHYVRGHYSRDGEGDRYSEWYRRDGMREHIEGMMRDAQDDRTREALRRCLDDLG